MSVSRLALCFAGLAAASLLTSGLPSGQSRLPIARRTFLTGTTPNPDQTRNLANALSLSKQAGPVTMLWVEPNGIGLYDRLCRPLGPSKKTQYEVMVSMGFLPVVCLNPWTVQPGRGVVRNDGSGSADFADRRFQSRMCAEAEQIAKRFKPRYFSIGNEINSVYELLGLRPFQELAGLEKALYHSVKKVSKDTRVIVVLSYSQLMDRDGSSPLNLLDHVRGSYDVLGLTSYPWRKYDKPSDLPGDYYARIGKHAHAPICFTEIGWSSEEKLGGSEAEQTDYLVRFLLLTRNLKLEFVNWSFLHDLPETAVTGFVVQRTHLGLGLRRYDGTPKPIWSLFTELASLPEP